MPSVQSPTVPAMSYAAAAAAAPATISGHAQPGEGASKKHDEDFFKRAKKLFTATVDDEASMLEFQDSLDDVQTRFLLNLPTEELATSDRIFFQLEQAWWFYEDMICDRLEEEQNSKQRESIAALKDYLKTKHEHDQKVKQVEQVFLHEQQQALLMQQQEQQGQSHPNQQQLFVQKVKQLQYLQQQLQQFQQQAPPPPSPSITTLSTIKLPRFATLKSFAHQLFDWSPLLDVSQFSSMWREFSDYKRRISTYGTILLNQQGTHVVLVQTWNGQSWTFPAGKINQGERGTQAAARETFEETGFDPHCEFGLTKEYYQQQQQQRDLSSPEHKNLVTWSVPLDGERNAIAYQENVKGSDNAGGGNSSGGGGGAASGKRRTCYICHGVPMDFPFEPVARKEVSNVSWFAINDLSKMKKTYAVVPFLGRLRKWIRKNVDTASSSRPKSRPKSRDKSRPRQSQHPQIQQQQQQQPQSRDKSSERDKTASSPKKANRRGSAGGGKKKSNKGSAIPSSSSHSKSGNIVQTSWDPLVDSGLANVGDTTRWSEDEMFRKNAELLGRTVEYDGNPHLFAEQGFFTGNDPHAFRVVGGSLMNNSNDANKANSSSASSSAKVPPPQPPAPSAEAAALPLTPFFTQEGVTPWGEVVEGAKSTTADTTVTQHPSSSASSMLFLNSVADDGTGSGGTNPGEALLAMLQKGTTLTDTTPSASGVNVKTSSKKKKKNKKRQATNNNDSRAIIKDVNVDDDDEDDGFAWKTDKEITAAAAPRNEGTKSMIPSTTTATTTLTKIDLNSLFSTQQQQDQKEKDEEERKEKKRQEVFEQKQKERRQLYFQSYQRDTEFVQQWVKQLPKLDSYDKSRNKSSGNSTASASRLSLSLQEIVASYFGEDGQSCL